MIRFLPFISFSSGLRLARAGVACSLLAGCLGGVLTDPRPTIVPPMMLADRDLQGCGRQELAHLTGQSFVELADYRLPGQLRVLRPGQGITRDLMPDRLNAQVDNEGRILRLFCG